MMRSKTALLLMTIAVVAGTSYSSQAEQFVARHGGRQVVVHTNPIPVLLHRAVPPNVGRHVTLREYKALQRSGGTSNSR